MAKPTELKHITGKATTTRRMAATELSRKPPNDATAVVAALLDWWLPVLVFIPVPPTSPTTGLRMVLNGEVGGGDLVVVGKGRYGSEHSRRHQQFVVVASVVGEARE
ncbi:unnamed protein product [Lactuca virosa]|uniref:Dirigent protein n=1 Tax=Lactuca virosa TaxID=75947 RepID=A0AAU9MI18_9ASTR|nr:unnamed protein product [Lactuca virosa]